MDVLIVFDLEGHGRGLSKFKDEMKSKGYFDNWVFNNQTVSIPNSSLFKKDTDLKSAMDDIKEVIKTLNNSDKIYNLVLDRCVVVPASPWIAISGKKHQ
jgi:hypothetical protein